jgi:hypothetical protein
MPEPSQLLDLGVQREILVSRIGINPTQPAAAVNAFFEEVYRYCVRLMVNTPTVSGALAFILCEHGIDVDPVYEVYSKEFISTGRLDVEMAPIPLGPIVLTTRNLRVAFATHCEETDALGVGKRLQVLGLGSRPTVIFVPSQRMLTFYGSGVDQKPSLSQRTDFFAGQDLSNIDALLDHFHQHWTRYPSGYGTCWDNATNRIVERNAERNIRNHLFLFLGMIVYKSPYIIREYDRPNGRVDIFVFGIAVDEPDHDQVLELKVLRSRSSGWTAEGGKKRSYSDAANVRYVQRGLRQAKRYIDSTRAIAGFLLCFDARLGNTEIDVRDYACELGVKYRRYYMESSVEEQ